MDQKGGGNAVLYAKVNGIVKLGLGNSNLICNTTFDRSEKKQNKIIELKDMQGLTNNFEQNKFEQIGLTHSTIQLKKLSIDFQKNAEEETCFCYFNFIACFCRCYKMVQIRKILKTNYKEDLHFTPQMIS